MSHFILIWTSIEIAMDLNNYSQQITTYTSFYLLQEKLHFAQVFSQYFEA